MDANFIIKLLKEISTTMNTQKELLIDLDSVVGDGDLGLTMSDGFRAAYNCANESSETDIGKLLYMSGKAMANAVPSTMGTLMASGLMQSGKALKGKIILDNNDIVELFKSFELGVMARGKAKIGEKTFIDGLDPAVKILEKEINSNETLKNAAMKAKDAACEGYENTTTMIAVHGRAATRGEDSKLLKDPGAYVAVLIMESFHDSL